MKQKLTVLFLCLIFFAGCGENYMAERAAWKAQRVYRSITPADLKTQGPAALEPAVEAYQAVFDNYPSAPMAADSLFVVANLRVRQNQYDKARQALAKIIKNYPGMPEKTMEARHSTARLYEAEGKWKEAESIYWDISEYHPYQARGLYSPVYIITHFKQEGNEAEQKRAYARAMDHYDRLLKLSGAIGVTAAVKNYQALAKLIYGDVDDAVAIWLEIVKEFPESPNAPLALLAAAETSWQSGKEVEALADYARYFKEYPEHPMQAATAAQIGHFYLAKKDYAEGRRWFTKSLTHLGDNADARAATQLIIARSYDTEGNWDEAEKRYQKIESEFADSPSALQVPLFRALHLKAVGQEAEAKKMLLSLSKRYEYLENQSQDPKKTLWYERLRHVAYAQAEEWERLLQDINEKLARETAPGRKGDLLFLKALITSDEIGDKEQAKALFENFLKDYPSHPLVSVVKNRQEALAGTSGTAQS